MDTLLEDVGRLDGRKQAVLLQGGTDTLVVSFWTLCGISDHATDCFVYRGCVLGHLYNELQ